MVTDPQYRLVTNYLSNIVDTYELSEVGVMSTWYWVKPGGEACDQTTRLR